MKYILVIILLIPILSISAFACSLSSDFNLKINGTVPSFLPYYNERVNVFIGEEVLGSLVIEDKVLTSLSCNTTSNPTYVISATNKSVLTNIFFDKNPIEKLDYSISNKFIIIEGQSFSKEIKSSLTKTLIKIFSWF